MSQGERKARPLARFLVSELVIRHWSLVSLVIRHSAESVILSAAKDLRGIERPFHSNQILQSLSLHQDDMRACARALILVFSACRSLRRIGRARLVFFVGRR